MAYGELRELADHGNISCGTALNELLDEVERQAKEIVELEEHEVGQCERAAEMLLGKDREITSLNILVSDQIVMDAEIEELTTDRDEWKRVAEDNTQGMKGQKAIIDKQNGVLHRVRTLRDYAERGKCQIRLFDLNVALNCTVCDEKREECKC